MIATEYMAPRGARRAQSIAFIAALVALALLLLGTLLPERTLGGGTVQFWRSYLLGWVYWAGVGLGALGVLMIQHLSGGVWGATLRRFLEAAALTIPVFGILFIPLALFGLHDVYQWTDASHMTGAILEQKALYLNTPFFQGRMVAYFVIWALLAVLLSRWSRRLDQTGDSGWQARMTRLSGPGMVLYAVTMTLATVDLLLSLDVEFFSTIWGALITIGMVLSAFALMIIVLALLTERGPLRGVVTGAHFLDVGKLLLAFTIIWTYFSLSQFLIIYSGNLPAEAAWFTNRLQGGWQWVAVALIIFQFLLPFLLLLSRGLKESPRRLVYVCALAFGMQYVHLIWLVIPNWHESEFYISWMDLAAPVAFGGIFFLVFAFFLRRRPLLPLYAMPQRHPRARTETQHAGQ